jgi:hypothetical protein
MDDFTYLLADFTSCKFSFGEESILQERNSKIQERTTNIPCKNIYFYLKIKLKYYIYIYLINEIKIK